MIETTEQIYSFAEFEVDAKKRRLSKNAQTVPLNPKAFDLLIALIENRGQIVQKEELLEAVWANQFVAENNLTVHISALRKIFGEQKGDHRFIVTVPGKGYKFVHEMREPASEIFIENHSFSRIVIDEEIEEIAEKKVAGKTTRRRFPYVYLVPLICLLVIGGGYFWRQTVWSNSAFENSFLNAGTKQLTTNGKVLLAALAPDGKTFAYVVNESGQRSLWLGYVDGGSHSPMRPATNDSQYYELAFAPDSAHLYFSYKDEKSPTAALYRMHIAGGALEKIADRIEKFAIASDGAQIAFGRRENEKDALLIADLNGAGEREIAAFEKTQSFVFDSLSWSPDGSRLAFSRVADRTTGKQELAIIKIADGAAETVKGDAVRDIAKTVWLKDGSGIILSALKADSQASVLHYNLFLAEIPGGKMSEITRDMSSYVSSLNLSQNSDAVLSIEHRQLNNVWIAPAEDLSQARQITFGSFGKYDGLWGLDFTPDGKIIYTNSDSKSQFISEMNADGSGSKPLTTKGKVDSQLNVSNDGRYIVFHSTRGAVGMDVWRMDADGGNAVQLTFGGRNFQPFVSADSRWVYYKSWEKETGELRRVPIEGGAPEILNANETSWLSFSPDGRYFAASYKTDKYRLAIFDAATDQLIKQFDLPKNATLSIGSRWSPDSRRVVYRDWNDGYWMQSIEGGEPQKMAGLPKEKFYNFAWSKDGKQFAFVRGQEIRDVVLLQTINK